MIIDKLPKLSTFYFSPFRHEKIYHDDDNSPIPMGSLQEGSLNPWSHYSRDDVIIITAYMFNC